MYPKKAHFFRIFLFVFSLAALALPSRAQVDGGTVVVHSSIEVVVQSSNSTARAIATKAFDAHGGYTVVQDSAASDFVVEIEPVGPNGARLQIFSGSPPQRLLSETLAGTSSVNAIFKAIDRTIYRTSKLPGIFSGKLAVISKATGSTEVVITDMFFQSLRQLTNDRSDALGPRWSPDGNSIVYTSLKNGFPDIHLLDLANNSARAFVSMEGANMGARFDPTGRRVAMSLTGNTNADIWVMNPGRSFKNLTQSKALETSPAWSPDGTRIVYASDVRGGNQLYVVPANGGTPRRLATNISGNCVEPDWNPANPRLIAFTAAQGSGTQIAVFDTQLGESRFITTESGDAREPQWLPDGRHIIYTHRGANRSEIKMIDSITGRSASLSGPSLRVSHPDYVLPR